MFSVFFFSMRVCLASRFSDGTLLKESSTVLSLRVALQLDLSEKKKKREKLRRWRPAACDVTGISSVCTASIVPCMWHAQQWYSKLHLIDICITPGIIYCFIMAWMLRKSERVISKNASRHSASQQLSATSASLRIKIQNVFFYIYILFLRIICALLHFQILEWPFFLERIWTKSTNYKKIFVTWHHLKS